MKQERTITIGAHELTVDIADDLYGEGWWNRVESGDWEPSTLGWVESKVGVSSYFIDLGAASGLLSILSAQNGASVVAVEPHPQWIEVLKKNVNLNSPEINVVEKAVAEHDGVADFRVRPNRRVMTDISRPISSIPLSEIPTVSLITLLSSRPKSATKTFLKIDIEGIEYVILRNLENLQALKKANANVLVSLHPGFMYARDGLPSVLQPFLNRWARVRGLVDNLYFFAQLRNYADIALTNGERCNSPLRAAVLSYFGCNDFVLSFDADAAKPRPGSTPQN